jgi:hypothetical protein
VQVQQHLSCCQRSLLRLDLSVSQRHRYDDLSAKFRTFTYNHQGSRLPFQLRVSVQRAKTICWSFVAIQHADFKLILLIRFLKIWSLQRSRLHRCWRKWRRSRRRYRRIRHHRGHCYRSGHSLLDCPQHLGHRMGSLRLLLHQARSQHVQHWVVDCLRKGCLNN